jgi:hypothetical protein
MNCGLRIMRASFSKILKSIVIVNLPILMINTPVDLPELNGLGVNYQPQDPIK